MGKAVELSRSSLVFFETLPQVPLGCLPVLVVPSRRRKEGSTGVGSGWGGKLVSFLTIIFDAVSLGAANQKSGIFGVLNLTVGFINGRTLAAVFMTLRKQVKSTCYFRVLFAGCG